MQTFLPYANFVASARCLDAVRLRKQRLEAFQILSCLQDPITLEERKWRSENGYNINPSASMGWSNHPAIKMWRGYEDALRLYYNAMVNERPSGSLRVMRVEDHRMPLWLGTPELHSSHRSRLHFKGSVDVLTKRIKLIEDVRSAKKWLISNGFPVMNVMTAPFLMKINNLLDEMKISPCKNSNWYDRWNWSEANTCLPYQWPTENGLVEGTRYDA